MRAVMTASFIVLPRTSTLLDLRPLNGSGSNSRWTPRPASAVARPPARQHVFAPVAASGSSFSGPAYNKYRSRGDIEREYYQQWNEMTVVAEREGKRAMTAVTLLAFLPSWFKFYVIPGPIRYLLFLLARAAAHVLHCLRKHAVLAGAKLDAALLQRSGHPADTSLMCKTALQRLHGTRGMLDLRYRLRLLHGDAAQ